MYTVVINSNCVCCCCLFCLVCSCLFLCAIDLAQIYCSCIDCFDCLTLTNNQILVACMYVDCSGFSCYQLCLLTFFFFVDSMYVFQDVSDDGISTPDITAVVEKSVNMQSDESKLDTRRFILLFIFAKFCSIQSQYSIKMS